MGAAGKVDRFQRRVPVLGVPLAVIYKYFDDQGNYLAAMLAFYAFIAIFPLLLLATSILGFLLQGFPDLERATLDSALAQFPIIGDELGRPGRLRGSVSAIVVGGFGALYGALGLGLGLQNAQAQAWGVPRNSRPHPVLTRLTSLLLLVVAGSAILTVSVFSAVLTGTELVGTLAQVGWFRWAVRLVTVIILALMLTVLLRMASARASAHTIRRAFPGAVTMAVLWQLLQYLGTVYVARVLGATDGMDATFALVLGLMGMLYIGAIMGVLGIEVNVVLARNLWPRALATPFTDRVDLTDADRRAYAMYAQTQRHKGFETVTVRFDGRDGDTHEILLDPTTEEEIRQRIPSAPPFSWQDPAGRDESDGSDSSPTDRRG
ncbi:YihY/virulence factor BrkB family protein [Nocardioides panacisoli]|uniref:YihY/virulence factor BrkB family protein n=1 Tax=Nocardioides panacisoli TaxID=627624 RepID=UPI001C625068|nr:YihY/virulence factor BrkB family protein [Nocardioides panacisoli]QYJ03181.1 YihY/virulence factor BrkB family protein [Nocardioides panacisoli]